MLKQMLFCTALITSNMVGSLDAQQPDHARPSTPSLVGWPEQIAEAPGIDHTLILPDVELRAAAIHPTQASLDAIAAWLSKHFDLPASNQRPQVELASPAQIAALRYRGFVPRQPQTADDQAMLDAGREIVAVYDDTTQTIYLPDGWSGTTPAERSVLVHEMVHHLQNVAGLKYACPQEREKLAFAAQERWLGLSGSSLSEEFQTDGMTLLVRTNCIH